MGQNTALKTRRLKNKKSKSTEKKEEKRLKAQKEDFNKKLHETPKGEEIYIYVKIYMKKRIYVYISKGLYNLTLGVLPTFSET